MQANTTSSSGRHKDVSDASGMRRSDEGGRENYSRIEQVAARTGLTKRTLRYYEEIGLLPAPTRTEGGYRLYSEADVLQLERIKRLKDLLGFSLSEIREIAQAEEERDHVRAAWAQEHDPHTRLEWLDRVESLTRDQLRIVDEKLAGLQEMRANLQARLNNLQGRRAQLLADLEGEEIVDR